MLATAAACVAPPTAAGFTTSVIASGGANSKPDDITELAGQLYVSFQNGVGAAGQPAPSGRRTSIIARFTLAGKRTGSWDLPGKCDGLTADPAHGRLIATVNEDGNSSLYTLAPATGRVQHYTYKRLTHGGGTDSISIVAGQAFVAASAPTPGADGKTFTKPALYKLIWRYYPSRGMRDRHSGWCQVVVVIILLVPRPRLARLRRRGIRGAARRAGRQLATCVHGDARSD